MTFIFHWTFGNDSKKRQLSKSSKHSCSALPRPKDYFRMLFSMICALMLHLFIFIYVFVYQEKTNNDQASLQLKVEFKIFKKNEKSRLVILRTNREGTIIESGYQEITKNVQFITFKN